MDKKEIQRRIRIMQAWVDGEAIEYYGKQCMWFPVNKYAMGLFSWSDCDYRIKAEPFECWVNVYGRDKTYYETEDGAKNSAREGFDRCAVHMREVTDE